MQKKTETVTTQGLNKETLSGSVEVSYFDNLQEAVKVLGESTAFGYLQEQSKVREYGAARNALRAEAGLSYSKPKDPEQAKINAMVKQAKAKGISAEAIAEALAGLI